jgi:aminomethyltransferase
MSGSDTATQRLRRTPLYDQHIALGARMVPFAGWEMPVQYQGIVEEHHAVRQRAGLFDVSHMGRLQVTGPDAVSFLRRLVTYDVTKLEPGRGHYALVCRDDGGILDDVYVFCLAEERYLVVVNSANADRILDWSGQHLGPSPRASLADRQVETAMLALQGPAAADHLAALASPRLPNELKRHRCAEAQIAGVPSFVSRTGYTGEDGFEIVVPADEGANVWQAFVEAGVQPCGLGARDTLRLEAALPLYGNDIDVTTNPFEAGLGWVVTFDDGADFLARDALLRIHEAGVHRQLACLKAEERGVMRPGCPILHDAQPVGELTSGSFSPTLGVSIGMGYLPTALAAEGAELQVDVRGRLLRVRVVPRPFYKRPKSP